MQLKRKLSRARRLSWLAQSSKGDEELELLDKPNAMPPTAKRPSCELSDTVCNSGAECFPFLPCLGLCVNNGLVFTSHAPPRRFSCASFSHLFFPPRGPTPNGAPVSSQRRRYKSEPPHFTHNNAARINNRFESSQRAARLFVAIPLRFCTRIQTLIPERGEGPAAARVPMSSARSHSALAGVANFFARDFRRCTLVVAIPVPSVYSD